MSKRNFDPRRGTKTDVDDEPATLEDLQNNLGEEARVQSKAARDATEFGARKISMETNENEDD